MKTRTLGSTGPTVSALGLGCMGMSDLYGPADDAESVATLRAALDAGVTLLDTGDFYGAGHNELLIREALPGRNRDEVAISVKFGALRGPEGSWLGVDGRPAAVKSSLAYTLRRLGTDHVDVYRLARLDPAVPVEETVGAIAELVQAGYVRHIGLSEVGADTLRRAHAVHPDRGPADRVLPGLPWHRGGDPARPPVSWASASRRTACSPAGCSAATGPAERETAHRLPRHRPRFQGENLHHEPAPGRGAAGRRRGRGARPSPRRPSPGCSPAARTRAAGRRPSPRPARRGPRRARPAAVHRRPRRDRGGRAGVGRGRDALRRRADGVPGQRA